MPEKDGSEDKKSTKSVLNKKQKQFMNQEEQLDLSSVAESFGGQIIGEPVELNEALPLAAAIPYLMGAGIIGTGAVGYDSYQKMRGKSGILPDLSGAVKGVYDKIRGVYRSTTRTDQENTNKSKYYKKRSRNLSGSDASSRTGDMKKNKYNNNQNNKNNNKKFNKRDAAIGFGVGAPIGQLVSTLTKTGNKGKGFRVGGLPGTAHNVGRRVNPQ